MKLSRVHTTALILFLGLAASYVCLSPGSLAGRGYADEEIASGLRILEVTTAWTKGHVVPAMIWSRHGALPILFDLPFLKLGKRVVSPDFMLSFQPGLLTAALVALLFLWLRKLCTPAMSLFLALAGAFATMLWPYAYIGLETKQSFFVFLAGYLALADGKIRTWIRLLIFAATCGIALSLKTTGVVLGPMVAFLLYEQFHVNWRQQRSRILAAVLVIGSIWWLGHWSAGMYYGPLGAGAGNLRPWLIDSPFLFFSNVLGVFGSPTKGLFLYSPVLIACIYAIPCAYRKHRAIVIYALLTVSCTLGLLCVLKSPMDEVWGCRYMHLAIAPLILCIGAAWPRFTWRSLTPLVALTILGVVISFLGAFYYYGARDVAMTDAGQNTLEWILGDGVWNTVQFHARLFGVWLAGTGHGPVLWTPNHVWVWAPPPDAMSWKSINLRDYCQPQSFMIRFWHVPKEGLVQRIFATYLSSLLAGVLLLIWAALRTMHDQRTSHAESEGRIGEAV